jgi:hypothetical protein
MRKGNLTREQLVEIVGEENVAALERLDCEPTNRLQCDGDQDVEFAASLRCRDKQGDECRIVAYYYQPAEAVKDAETFDRLEWKIHGYAIE